MATNIFTMLGLYFAMFVYTATGVVDPSIFSNWITDIIRMITTAF